MAAAQVSAPPRRARRLEGWVQPARKGSTSQGAPRLPVQKTVELLGIGMRESSRPKAQPPTTEITSMSDGLRIASGQLQRAARHRRYPNVGDAECDQAAREEIDVMGPQHAVGREDK